MDEHGSGAFRLEEMGAGFGPEAEARADVVRNQSESTTPTGLMTHAVRTSEQLITRAIEDADKIRQRAHAEGQQIVTKYQEIADKLLDDARGQAEHQRSEQRAIATTTGELIASQLSHLQTLGEVTEKLRQPVERPPTAAEVAGDVVKTIATLGQSLLMKNPRLLQGAAERWAVGAQRADEEEGPAAAPAAQDAATEAEFSALKLSDLEALIDELPQDFLAAFAKERGLTDFDHVTIGDVRVCFNEIRRRRAAAGKTPHA